MSALRLGVHLSLGRHPLLALQEACIHNVQAAQIFVSSPGAWKPPKQDRDDVASLNAKRAELDVNPLFIHSIYLVNLASSDDVLVSRSSSSLVATMNAGSALQASGVVTHLGSHAGAGFDAIADQVASELLRILEQTPDDIDLILENSAGSGNILGSSLDELGALIALVGNHHRLKVAIDIAHLCAAGWDFKRPNVACELALALDAIVGLERVAVIHANDSKVPCGSRVDRHAVIGEGHVGTEGFRNVLAVQELQEAPWILETPDLGSQDATVRFVGLQRLRELSLDQSASIARAS